MENQVVNWNAFISKWGIHFEKVKQLLDFLKTSPAFIEEFELTAINDSTSVEESQKEWLKLLSILDHPMDKEFLKPNWIPLENNGYNLYLEINQNSISLIDYNFFFLKPYKWNKLVIYEDINDLIADSDNASILKHKREQLEELELDIFRECMMEREAAALNGLIKIDPIEYNEIFDAEEGYKNDLFIWDGEKTIFNKVGALIIGLFPYEMPLKLEEMLYDPDIEYDENEKIKTVRDFVFILRENGISFLKEYTVKIGESTQISYNSSEFIIYGNDYELIDEFCRAYMKLSGLLNAKG